MHPTMRGCSDVESRFAMCAPDMLDKWRKVVHRVESFPPLVGTRMEFDDGKNGFHRGFGGDKDADTSDRVHAWSTDHSDESPLHDDSKDLLHDGPSLGAAVDLHNRNVGSRMGASEASRA